MNLLCLDFVNTQWFCKHKPFKENLLDIQWRKNFFEKWNIVVEDINEEEVNTLINFRSELFQILSQTCVEKMVSEESLRFFNKYLDRVNLTSKIEHKDSRFKIEMVPDTAGINLILYKIILDCAELICTYNIEYLKMCSNPDCDWIFYDDSKSHTRKWCDNKCASRMKVRKHRAKKSDAK